MDFKFSRFLKTIKERQKVIVFHRLHPDPFCINILEWESFQKDLGQTNTRLINKLKRRHLLIKSGKEDTDILEEIRNKYEKRINQITTLYLILTHKCNLRCKYCFVRYSFNKKDRQVMMTSKIAREGIELWARHLTSNSLKNLKYFIIFYGGEPLLNFPVLGKSLEYIEVLQRQKKLPKRNLEIIVVTNGTLINKKIAELLKKHNVGVTVSLDGPEKVHDILRKTIKGKGTFERIKKTIKLLQEQGTEVRASITATPYNLKLIRNIPDFLLKLGIKNFGINRLVGETLFYIDPSANLEKYNKKFARESMKSFIKGKKKGVCEEKIQEKIDSFTQKIFYPADCKAYGGQIVIQPNGYVSNCHASSRYNIKHLSECDGDFRIQKTALVNNWRQRLPLYNQECLKCEAISICGGGCPWDAEELKSDFMKKDDASCIYTKEIFRFILNKLKQTFKCRNEAKNS